MRWLYPDPNDKEENAARSAVVSRIERWWQAFAERADEIRDSFHDDSEFDIPGFMRASIEQIDQRLGWEFGPALNGDGDRLVITPEHNLALRPLADAIIARAPELPGWEFFHARPPEPPNVALAAVEAETDVELGKCEVCAETDDMNRVALKFYLPEAIDRELAGVQAAIAAEALLGEESFARWIGRIDVSSREDGSGWGPLSDLHKLVFAQVEVIDDTLFKTPLVLNVDRLQWSLWRLSPPKKDEYPRQQDLIMGSSALDSMSACAQLGQSFDSRRYSRAGETFCFLKFDGEGRKIAQRMDERKVVEDSINEALVAAELGVVVGTGTGKKYSYLDLALTDLNKAIPEIVKQMRAAKVANRSWLLFHDAHLADEWIGIHEDTPPPPR
ncbi:MAG: hypothetical protein KDB82_05150 [Planctomycetes bacterium]|nr:hypothetical protein [Planctomycetota bacterium]